ncbi:MAG: prepilin peptidase [Actinomycetota bacterium]|nr:prepilin peptidase [Actinomycetota bacterium]
MLYFAYISIFILGLVFGSFFNVSIYRMPRGLSLGGRSFCPRCKSQIAWYDNIPLLSFVALRGRCRSCGGRISPRYPIVELSTALLFVLSYHWTRSFIPHELGVGEAFLYPELALALTFVGTIVVAVGTDIDSGVVPNRLIFPATALAAALVVGISIFRGEPERIAQSLISALIGGGFLLLVGLSYGYFFMKEKSEIPQGAPPSSKLEGTTAPEESLQSASEGTTTSREQAREESQREGEVRSGVGMGDVKLMFFVGLCLGYFHWYLVIPAILFSYILGGFVSLVLIAFGLLKRKERIPFVPFLGAGSVLAMIWGEKVVEFYLKLLS